MKQSPKRPQHVDKGKLTVGRLTTETGNISEIVPITPSVDR